MPYLFGGGQGKARDVSGKGRAQPRRPTATIALGAAQCCACRPSGCPHWETASEVLVNVNQGRIPGATERVRTAPAALLSVRQTPTSCKCRAFFQQSLGLPSLKCSCERPASGYDSLAHCVAGTRPPPRPRPTSPKPCDGWCDQVCRPVAHLPGESFGVGTLVGWRYLNMLLCVWSSGHPRPRLRRLAPEIH